MPPLPPGNASSPTAKPAHVTPMMKRSGRAGGLGGELLPLGRLQEQSRGLPAGGRRAQGGRQLLAGQPLPGPGPPSASAKPCRGQCPTPRYARTTPDGGRAGRPTDAAAAGTCSMHAADHACRHQGRPGAPSLQNPWRATSATCRSLWIGPALQLVGAGACAEGNVGYSTALRAPAPRLRRVEHP